MKWVEIINSRLVAPSDPLGLERLFHDIRESVARGSEEGVRMVIYKSRFVDSDWAIHLHRESDNSPLGRTGLGIKLAELIRPMGLVDYSIWIEEDGGIVHDGYVNPTTLEREK